jgi:hypothetical protein
VGACSGECSRMISAEDDQTFPCSSGTFTHAFKLEGVEAAGGKSEAMCRDEDERTYLTSSQYVTAPSKTPVPQTNVFDSDNLDVARRRDDRNTDYVIL